MPRGKEKSLSLSTIDGNISNRKKLFLGAATYVVFASASAFFVYIRGRCRLFRVVD